MPNSWRTLEKHPYLPASTRYLSYHLVMQPPMDRLIAFRPFSCRLLLEILPDDSHEFLWNLSESRKHWFWVKSWLTYCTIWGFSNGTCPFPTSWLFNRSDPPFFTTNQDMVKFGSAFPPKKGTAFRLINKLGIHHFCTNSYHIVLFYPPLLPSGYLT